MAEPMRCTVSERDEKGVGRCPCSLVTATGGDCEMFGPLPTFAEAFPYLTTHPAPTSTGAGTARDTQAAGGEGEA